ncbi:MAG: SPASM domain-containing protein [Gammaproteobacteria bacterium]|jgi:radical SAM protein with 4Fe4S-binding SPASM domain|nr:SPASM domain-containing protein [Gammaproteobacteria bacterium]
MKQMPSEHAYNIINQARDLGYQGRIKLHRLSEPLIDPRYIEFANYIKDHTKMQLMDDTNGNILRKKPRLIPLLDGVVFGFVIGLYDVTTEEEKQAEMNYFRSAFKKTKVAFSLPQEACLIRQNSKVYDETFKDSAALNLPCFQPQNYMHIRYDGNVSLCCEDDQCNFSLGNAFEQSLKDIWWSDRHMMIARELAKPGGRHSFEVCKTCYNAQDRIRLERD